MFKRISMIVAAAAFAVVMMPAASEAGSVHKRGAHSGCALTKMFNRTERAVRTAVRPARVLVRPARVHAHRAHGHRAHRMHRAHGHKK